MIRLILRDKKSNKFKLFLYLKKRFKCSFTQAFKICYALVKRKEVLIQPNPVTDNIKARELDCRILTLQEYSEVYLKILDSPLCGQLPDNFEIIYYDKAFGYLIAISKNSY